MSEGERIEKLRVLVERMVGALGEENIVTLDTLNDLGAQLDESGELEEARTVYERCLAGQERVLGEDHKKTLSTVNDLGVLHNDYLKDYKKALEYFERTLKGYEKTLGKTHPSTLTALGNIGEVQRDSFGNFEKAESLLSQALQGHEAQLGKDNKDTEYYVEEYKKCLELSGNIKRLEKLKKEYPWLDEESSDEEEAEEDY